MSDINDTTGASRVNGDGSVEDLGGHASVDLTTNEPGDSGRPAWLPEGFDTVEDFRAAYDKMVAGDTLEGSEGADSTPAGEGVDTLEGSEGGDKEFDEEALRASLKEAGGIYADPRYEPYAIEFEKTGDLSPESIAKAAADFGVPDNAVSDFIAGQKAMRENATLQTAASEADFKAQAETLVKNAGLTREQYTGDGTGAFDKWAAENIPEADLNRYNEMTDLPAAEIILKGWADKFKAATRVPRDATQGGSGPTSGAPPEVTPFKSLDEQLQAQGSAKYASDPTYRREVEARIMASRY